MSIEPLTTRRRAAQRVSSMMFSQPSGRTERAASLGQIVAARDRCCRRSRITRSSLRSRSESPRRRHSDEHHFTESQSRSHFLRHSISRPHRVHHFVSGAEVDDRAIVGQAKPNVRSVQDCGHLTHSSHRDRHHDRGHLVHADRALSIVCSNSRRTVSSSRRGKPAPNLMGGWVANVGRRSLRDRTISQPTRWCIEMASVRWGSAARSRAHQHRCLAGSAPRTTCNSAQSG